MEIFISWSGNRSKLIAEQLRNWLKGVLQFTAPWCSDKDIRAGEHGYDAIRIAIKDAKFAIICLTKENLNSPWINYEAGAIAEKLNGRVCPYLFQMSPSELEKSPLAHLQAVVGTDKQATLKLLKSINSIAKKELQTGFLEEEELKEFFEVWWKKLEDSLSDIGKSPKPAEPTSEMREGMTVHRETVVHNFSDIKCDHLFESMQLLSTSLLSVIEQQIKSKDNLIQELVRDGNTYKPELIRLKVEKEALEEHMPKFRETLDSLSHLMEKAKSYKKISRWLEVIISENKHQEISKEALDKANPPRNQEEDETFHKIFCEYLKWVVDGLNRGGPVKRIPSIPVLPVQIYREAFENLKHKAHSRLSNDEVAMLMEFIDHLLGCLGSSNKLLEE